MGVKSQLAGLAFCVTLTGFSVYEGINNFKKELDVYNKEGVAELTSLEYKLYRADLEAKKTMSTEDFAKVSELYRKCNEAYMDKAVVAAKKEYEYRSTVSILCTLGTIVGLLATSVTYGSLRNNC
ncbi:MAG: hypothetical protein ACP5N3_06455 [Candidatus Nanoarchaeia archaeon]